MTAEIDNIKIAYDRFGEGDELLVIFHGWGCNKELFAPIATHLAKKYTVVACDMPGCGESPEPPRPFSVDDYADLFIKFIDSFGFKTVSLMGHSYGGRIIIKLFSKGTLPFKVKRVCLIDSAGIKPKKTLGQNMSLVFYKCGRKFLLLPPLKKLFPKTLDAWRKKRGSADYNSASAVMKQTLVLAVNEDLTDCLKNIDCPTLLFWGDKDDATPLSDAKIMEKKIPDAGLVVLEGGSHFSFLENMPYFLRVADSFFEN